MFTQHGHDGLGAKTTARTAAGAGQGQGRGREREFTKGRNLTRKQQGKQKPARTHTHTGQEDTKLNQHQTGTTQNETIGGLLPSVGTYDVKLVNYKAI